MREERYSKLLMFRQHRILRHDISRRTRWINDKLLQSQAVHEAFKQRHVAPEKKPTQTIVLENMDDTVALTSSVSVTAGSLWNSTRVAREKREVREQNKVFVVGGAKAIKRIWHEYRIRPNVVYVPNTEDVPSWCTETDLTSLIVRCSPVDVNKKLLSAERNDGFAAEFPMPVQPPLDDALEKSEGGNPTRKINAMLVLHKVMIPSNVGMLVRAAVEFGFDSILLDRCADAFHEKVLRASEGVLLNPKVKVFQMKEEGKLPSAPAMQQMALNHQLLPIFAVPSQEAEPLFTVAKRFHETNIRNAPFPNRKLGMMLLMGSESKGLVNLESEWTMPYQPVSIPMQNASVTSMNVAAAGSIIMQYFRPNAQKEFEKLLERHEQLELDAASKLAIQSNSNATETPTALPRKERAAAQVKKIAASIKKKGDAHKKTKKGTSS